jgi:hypothetical protein
LVVVVVVVVVVVLLLEPFRQFSVALKDRTY